MKKLSVMLLLFAALCLIASPAFAGKRHWWGGGGGGNWDSDSDSDSWDSDSDSDSWKDERPSGAVPEPTSALVFGAGAVAMGWALKRRKE